MANTPEVKQGEGLPDLDDLLQCPVCYEIPTGQIFQCNEGHHVCSRCKLRLHQCPVCRGLFFGTRNYAMEELIANVRKLQAFKLGGKTTVSGGSGGSESTTSADNSVAGTTLDGSVGEEDTDNTDQQLATIRAPAACKGLFRCLVCKNANSERLPAARLLNHLRYFHGPELIEGKSEGGEYLQAWQIATVPGRIVIAVRVTDMGVFFLVIEISNEAINAWVSMAAAPLVAHDFCYTITISGNDREAVFTDCVWSVRSCEGALKKRGRCLTVGGADVRAITASDAVSGRLALRRAPPDQLADQPPRAVLRVASRPPGTAATTPAPAAAAAEPRRLEPFLQDLQHDVARLSRAFATLGREASALARSEADIRARVDRVDRMLPAPQQQPPPPVVTPPQTPPPQPQQQVPQMSRNARRRMRQRLRAALDDTRPPQRPQPQPRTFAVQNGHERTPAAPAPAPAPAAAPRVFFSGLAIVQPAPPAPPAPRAPPGEPSHSAAAAVAADQTQRTNRKKRRQRR